MCGIAGIYNPNLKSEEWENILRLITDKLAHRGPDDAGYWYDARFGIGLGHRRLSIIDLSQSGHQPMISASGRYCITFNGEIYNFQELRDELISAGYHFIGASDTEVMLAAFEKWGVRRAVDRFIGMFAFGVWDYQNRSLSLVRDRMGIKPLYYGIIGRAFVFGSELKALRTYPGFGREINRNALALFMRHNYISSPYSIYQDIYKLLPGSILVVTETDTLYPPTPQLFWNLVEIAENGINNLIKSSPAEAIEELDQLLKEAVRLRMIADVPLGAFLSGGIDSSLIVSLMQAQSTIPIKTFTIGFSDKGYNEAEYAKEVAKYLHTDHTELYLSPEQTMSVLQDMPTLYDEPFSDSSQIPTFLISRLARQQVTVSLSGDGSDEIFGGYDRYIWAKSIWQYAGWLKPSAQMIIKKISHMINWDTLDLIFPGKKRSNSIGITVSGETVRKFVEFIPFCSQADLYIKLLSHWQHPELLVRGCKEPLLQMIRPSINRTSSSFNNYMMLVDQTYYLPNDILQKVDRASMGVALEVRVPYLDHRIVEFAWRLPLSFKIRDNQTKWILRHVLSKYLPMSLVDRPKQGFALPLGKWLRGPLRDWVEPLLDQSSIRQEGYLNADLIQDVWLEHLSGKRDRQYLIWDILMFEAWLREQRDL